MFLATQFHGGLLDLIVVSIIIFISLIGLKQGFVNRLVGVVAGIIALLFAIALCKPFANLLEIMFGMQSGLTNSISRSFAKNENLNVMVTDIQQVKNLLANQNMLPSFIKDSVLKLVDATKEQTVAQLIGGVCARFATIGFAFIIIWVSIRLLCILLKFVFAKIEDSHPSIFLANKILGISFAFLQSLIVISVILLVVGTLPSSVMGWLQRGIEKSKICKLLYRHNLLAYMFAFMVT